MTTDATMQMITELRRMAGRTGNKSAEDTMRNAASWLENMNAEYLKVIGEVDKLRQRLADKDEQLAGWKSLLDAKMAIDASTDTPATAVPAVKAKRKPPRPNYDYAGTLTTFYVSGEKTKIIPTQRIENGKKFPPAWKFRDKAVKLGIPVNAHTVDDYILLVRTDIAD